ncbi:hypothetical protein NHJ6243_004945 [Beauveria neobassiana]
MDDVSELTMPMDWMRPLLVHGCLVISDIHSQSTNEHSKQHRAWVWALQIPGATHGRQAFVAE